MPPYGCEGLFEMALIYTCRTCGTIVDYSCMCAAPPPIERLTGHDSVEDAKEDVRRMVADREATP